MKRKVGKGEGCGKDKEEKGGGGKERREHKERMGKMRGNSSHKA